MNLRELEKRINALIPPPPPRVAFCAARFKDGARVIIGSSSEALPGARVPDSWRVLSYVEGDESARRTMAAMLLYEIVEGRATVSALPDKYQHRLLRDALKHEWRDRSDRASQEILQGHESEIKAK